MEYIEQVSQGIWSEAFRRKIYIAQPHAGKNKVWVPYPQYLDFGDTF